MSVLTSSTYLRPRRRSAWGPLALAVGCLAAYGVFFVLPYLVNELYRLPLDEVASGVHDPRGMWPLNTPEVGWVWGIGAMATLVLGPLLAGASVLWAGAEWARRQGSMRRAERRVLGAAAACGAAMLLGLATPLGRALMTWWLG